MNVNKLLLGSLAFTGIISCTSLSEGAQTSELVPESENRVLVGVRNTETLRAGMNEQASEINRKRNIEEFNRNEPAMTPPTLRPLLVPNAPINKAIHHGDDWLMPHLFKNKLILIK